MSKPRGFRPVPDAADLPMVLVKIKARCTTCPDCEEPWLWMGNHQAEMWHATIEVQGLRYSVRRTVFAATSTKPLRADYVLATRCENQACLNPALLFGRTKGDVVRHQVAEGLIHHAQHRAAINRARRAHGATKLDMEKAREIRASDAPTAAVAELYGVSEQLIRRVRSNRNWREATPFTGLGAR
jgi:hypothetical protein